MTPQKELDIKVASMSVGRAIEEIIFCTLNPQLTGTHRREEAIKTFGEITLSLIKVIKGS